MRPPEIDKSLETLSGVSKSIPSRFLQDQLPVFWFQKPDSDDAPPARQTISHELNKKKKKNRRTLGFFWRRSGALASSGNGFSTMESYSRIRPDTTPEESPGSSSSCVQLCAFFQAEQQNVKFTEAGECRRVREPPQEQRKKPDAEYDARRGSKKKREEVN